MFVSENLAVNDKGHLTIGGYDTLDLVKRYGTPLYVMDEDLIRKNCRLYKNSIEKYYDGDGLAIFASKAFCCKTMCKIANEEGFGIDVVSGGELYTAIKAGFPAEKIYFHGNNKTEQEIILALEYGVGRFVVDNLTELETLNILSHAHGKTSNIYFRIKPGIDAHTHDFVQTGKIDSKFGVALENGEAMEAVRRAIEYPSIKLCGIHCHIGSQIFDIAPFELAAEKMIAFMADVKNEFGIEIDELNLGGGFGIKYLPEHDPVTYDSYMQKVSLIVKSACQKYNIKLPFILIEPGRSIVGPAGITLYTVGSIKKIADVRTYVAIDGGMADNPRYALYQSPYDAVIANRANEPRTKTVTIAGRCCESGDLIQENIKIQDSEPGDILAVFATGAYNYSMSSNYNRLPKPPVVMIKAGVPRVIIKGETYDDVIRNDI
jgi:diaminopimelate decarboxylase